MGSAGDVGVTYDKSCSACAVEDLLMCVEQHVSSFLISGAFLFPLGLRFAYMVFVSLFGWVFLACSRAVLCLWWLLQCVVAMMFAQEHAQTCYLMYF